MDKIITINSDVTVEQLPTAENLGDERRYPVQLFRYWDKLRGNRKFASEELIDPESIPELWPHCFLIQTNDLRNRRRADFTYFGSAILSLYHDLLSDEDANDIISPNTSHLAQNFWLVIERKAPLMQSGSFPTSRGNVIKFRQCLLPLGKRDDEVEAIFGCVRLKLYM